MKRRTNRNFRPNKVEMDKNCADISHLYDGTVTQSVENRFSERIGSLYRSKIQEGIQEFMKKQQKSYKKQIFCAQ
jgi:hypothetical protein